MNAQTFLHHLQTKVQGQGDVTVSEDAKIDELVNNASKTSINNVVVPKPKTVAKTKNADGTAKKSHKETIDGSGVKPTEKREHSAADREKENTKDNSRTDNSETISESNDDDISIETVDLRKKVMRNSYKVTGYRVQVYAGGNSRKARQTAERIGNDVKMNFPEEPVYTHFYPPRWICRVGNYRSYEEANSMLKKIKKMGYSEASIVKGKISVQY
jgi:hypothetical protein